MCAGEEVCLRSLVTAATRLPGFKQPGGSNETVPMETDDLTPEAGVEDTSEICVILHTP